MGAPIEFDTHLDLTMTGQDALGLPRLYPGDAVRWRFQVQDENGAPLDLTGYKIALVARRRKTDPEPALLRMSTVNIAGTATKEIGIDADQSAEDVEAFTGRGWFELRFLEIDEAMLLVAVGMVYFDIVLEAPDGSATTFAEGVLEIPRRMTRVANMP